MSWKQRIGGEQVRIRKYRPTGDEPTMNFISTATDERPVRVIRPTQSLIAILSTGLASLLSHKSLILEMTLLRLKVRYRQSVLGWIWAALPSLLLMITYTLVFSKAIGLQSIDLPYALFIFSGLVPWMFFSTSVSTATAGIVTHRYLICRVAFPREIIPLSYVAAALVDLGVGILMLGAMMYYFGFSPTLHTLYAVPIMGMLVVFSIAGALFCASFQARFRDVGVAMPLLLQVMMFATPVVYSSTAIPHSFKAIYFANPLAVLIESFREAAMLGVNPNAGKMIYCGVFSVGCLAFSYILFKRLDATLADVI
jgi:lipopolysaccharide transport system permease protein